MDNKININKQSEDFLTINDFWHLCIAHWNWFLVSLFLCLSAAAYYLYITPNLYLRQSAILVKQENQKNTGISTDNVVLSDVSVVQQQTNVPNIQRQLISIDVQSEVARRLGMAESEVGCRRVAQSLAARLKVNIENEKSSIINLSIVDTDPLRAEAILTSTVQVFNEKWLNEKNRISASTSAFIQERLALLEKELGAVDDSISNFKARNMITDIDRISDIYLQKQTTSDAQILALSNQKTMAEYLLEILGDKKTQHELLPTNSGINHSSVESQISQYNNMLLQLKNSMYNTSTQNPLIVRQEASIAELRSNIAATISNYLKTLDIQLDAYIDANGEANDMISQNPTQAKQLLSVEREQKVKESLYLYLLQKKEENEISTTYTSFITEVIDPPYGLDTPTSPKKANILFSAFLLGLLVPAVILFMRENLDTTVRDKYDIEHKTNLMLIGEVPYYMYDSKNNKVVAAPRFEIAPLRKLLFWRKIHKHNNPIVVQPDRQDLVNEAFRVIRTNLEFMTSKQGIKNVYIVTSNYEGSGKTIVSMNLSIALAIKEKHVLLIDGDLRHASASHYFDCPKVGFSDYLAEKENDIRSLIVTHSDYPTFEILPVGTIPPNPTELLATDRLAQMFDILRPLYDFIIVDCPPTESLADTGIIERQADRTLFIVRAGSVERKRIENIEADAQNGKYKQMSLILNGIKLGGRYSYRYGYKQRYVYQKG